jgi:hypothetical protein
MIVVLEVGRGVLSAKICHSPARKSGMFTLYRLTSSVRQCQPSAHMLRRGESLGVEAEVK